MKNLFLAIIAFFLHFISLLNILLKRYKGCDYGKKRSITIDIYRAERH